PHPQCINSCEEAMINKRETASNQPLNPPIPPLPKGGKGGFEAGFTMVELLVSMVMFVLLIAAASQIFTAQLTQFKQQSKIAETNIEGIIGLELLRRDIKHAGYGLPWVIPATVAYDEALSDPNGYNDDAANDPPRAIFSGDGNGYNSSDELIIKSTKIAISDTAQRWTWLRTDNVKRIWLSGDDFVNSDRVIVVFPGSTDANSRTLEVSSADPTIWKTTYGATGNFDPSDAIETNIIYGIKPPGSPVTEPRMPFNRADYYISTTNVPARCAEPVTGTGVLIKSVIQHAPPGNRGGGLPLLDCVADMQVVYRLDTTGDGTIDTTHEDLLATGLNLSAQQIRTQVKEVRVYILAQEGQKDPNFTFTRLGPAVYPGACATCIRVGPATGEGRDFDITTITDGVNYRWKLYILVVNPENLLE
ncbi:MAG: hypothetical protein L0956_07935, partial [Candidatus Mariimomonas ferrooxydans]